MNDVTVLESHCVMTITSSKHGRFEVLFDIEDLERVQSVRWAVHMKKNGGPGSSVYVDGNQNYGELGRRRQRRIILHRFLAGPASEQVVMHLNHDPLDNRRANLKIGTQRENMLTGIGGRPAKGVSFTAGRRRPWAAAVQFERKPRHLGRFATEDEAHEVYQNVSRFLVVMQEELAA